MEGVLGHCNDREAACCVFRANDEGASTLSMVLGESASVPNKCTGRRTRWLVVGSIEVLHSRHRRQYCYVTTLCVQLADMLKAGCEVKVLFANLHAYLDNMKVSDSVMATITCLSLTYREALLTSDTCIVSVTRTTVTLLLMASQQQGGGVADRRSCIAVLSVICGSPITIN